MSRGKRGQVEEVDGNHGYTLRSLTRTNTGIETFLHSYILQYQYSGKSFIIKATET